LLTDFFNNILSQIPSGISL